MNGRRKVEDMKVYVINTDKEVRWKWAGDKSTSYFMTNYERCGKFVIDPYKNERKQMVGTWDFYIPRSEKEIRNFFKKEGGKGTKVIFVEDFSQQEEEAERMISVKYDDREECYTKRDKYDDLGCPIFMPTLDVAIPKEWKLDFSSDDCGKQVVIAPWGTVYDPDEIVGGTDCPCLIIRRNDGQVEEYKLEII